MAGKQPVLTVLSGHYIFLEQIL